MKKLFLTSLFLTTSFFSFGQIYQNSNWIFGNGGASLKFNSQGPQSPLNFNSTNFSFGITSAGYPLEGCAIVSEDGTNSEIILYTNGTQVFDKTNNVTPNGSGLLGNFSSSQNTIIVPQPNSRFKGYYVITIDGYSGYSGGLYWSEFNPLLNNYLGDIVTETKNTPFKYQGNELTYISTEKLTSTLHANGLDYWVVVQYGNKILSYRVSSSGISENPTVSTLPLGSDLGYIKISPLGDKIVITGGSNVYLGNFNNVTGQVTLTNSINQIVNNLDRFYGVDFSANGNNIYFQMFNIESSINRLYSVSVNNFNNANINLFQTLPSVNFVGIQRAIDGRIYINAGANNKISVVNDPNNIFNPNYVYSASNLDFAQRYPRSGFPQLVSFQSQNNTCFPLVLNNESNTGLFTYSDFRSITTVSNYNINSSAQNIVMKASDFILLSPNTYIGNGGNFQASIQTCGEGEVSNELPKIAYSSINEKVVGRKRISLYPNPSSSRVNIISEDFQFHSLVINSIDGKEVFRKKIDGINSYELDISNFLKGIYIVNITTVDGNNIIEKIIKN